MKFLDFFPTPDFLKISSYGFDISDESVKYIKFGDGKKGNFISEYGEKNLAPGIIENGEIKKEKEFTDFLISVFKDSRIKNIVVSLPEEKAFLDVIEFPKLSYSELKTAISTQFENYFPLKAKDAIFDFEILNEESALDFFDVLIIAFPKTLIESYKNCLVKAGFFPVVFEAEVEAIKRALSNKEDAFKMLIDFGKTRTTFIIIRKNRVLFTSTLKIGGEDLDKAISRSFSVSLEDAESVKKEKGKIFPFAESQFEKDAKEYKIQSVIMPVITSIQQEIVKYIEYWQTHYSHIHKKENGAIISEIILCGGDANFTGLSEYLNRNLMIPVRLANVWANVFSFEDYIPEIEFNESLKYVTAIGLALKARQMES